MFCCVCVENVALALKRLAAPKTSFYRSSVWQTQARHTLPPPKYTNYFSLGLNVSCLKVKKKGGKKVTDEYENNKLVVIKHQGCGRRKC